MPRNPLWKDHLLGARIIPRLTTDNRSVDNRCVNTPINPVHMSHDTTPKSTTDSAKWWFPQKIPSSCYIFRFQLLLIFGGAIQISCDLTSPLFPMNQLKQARIKKPFIPTQIPAVPLKLKLSLFYWSNYIIHPSLSLTHQLNHIWSTLGSPGIVPRRPRCDEPNPGVSQGLPLRKDLHHHSSAVETPRCCEVATSHGKSYSTQNKKVRGWVGFLVENNLKIMMYGYGSTKNFQVKSKHSSIFGQLRFLYVWCLWNQLVPIFTWHHGSCRFSSSINFSGISGRESSSFICPKVTLSNGIIEPDKTI